MPSSHADDKRKAYKLGSQHYQESLHCDEDDMPVCPYKSNRGTNDLRTPYWDGWYDTKHKTRLAVAGIDFPIKDQPYWTEAQDKAA